MIVAFQMAERKKEVQLGCHEKAENVQVTLECVCVGGAEVAG